MSIVKRLTYLSSLVVFLPALATAQTLSSLNKDEITSAFSDKTITTITAATLNNQLISDSFTGYFSKDGKMVGKFASKPQDQPQDDSGTWSVKPEGMLCYKWDHWNAAKEKCASVYKLSNGLLVVNGQNGFESFIKLSDIKSGNQVTK